MHFAYHFRIRVISAFFKLEKIVYKILSAACSKGGGIECMKWVTHDDCVAYHGARTNTK